MPVAYYIEMPVDFPEGVHFGAGKQFNMLAVARDGLGKPVLNGTSLAGVMRAIWRDYCKSKPNSTPENVAQMADLLFGERCRDDDDDAERPVVSSAVRVTNYELMMANQSTNQRTHHLRNRHRGTVVDGGLYSVESCPPGTSAEIGFWVYTEAASTAIDGLTDARIQEFLSVMSGAFQHGVCVGGNSNRGIGRAETNPESIKFRRFDLSVLQDQADQLDVARAWSHGAKVSGLTRFEPTESVQSTMLVIDLKLKIPRGQDILVADGQGQEVQMEPQRVIGVDGKYYWRIPGGSLRGLFRRWINRLSAREQLSRNANEPLAMSDVAAEYEPREDFERKIDGAYCEQHDRYRGDNLGWCFTSPGERDGFQMPADWHVESLFGTCFNPGRIKISDGFQKCTDEDVAKCPESQVRMHVAVDRVTGGAAEGMLFDNRVLIDPKQNASGFSFRISIRNPEEHDVRWLAQTLVALDIGVLRVGSSKSSGRLSLSGMPEAKGKLEMDFKQRLKQHLSAVT